MKKKIMIFLYTLSGGGAERTIINIINNLDKKKFEVVLVLGTEKNNDYIDLVNNDVKVIILNSKKLKLSIFKLVRCIRREKPNLLFSTINGNNLTLIIARVLSFKKIPIVVRESNNRTQSGKVSNFNKIMTTIFYNYLSDRVIALSEGVKKDLMVNFRVKKEKINVIYNPVEINKIEECSKYELDDVTLNKKEKVIISVGRLVEQKGFDTLIRSFALINKDIPVRLMILGKGPKESYLKNLSKSLGVEDRIHFLGFKKNPYKYMSKADLFVLSSNWEGFGHVIVEAMATGTPVLSTNCNSGPSEIIKNNKYGVLIPVGNISVMSKTITKLLSDKSLLEHYAKQGYIRARDFEASNITLKFEQVFDKLLNS